MEPNLWTRQLRGQGGLEAIDTDEVTQMFMPRKRAQRSTKPVRDFGLVGGGKDDRGLLSLVPKRERAGAGRISNRKKVRYESGGLANKGGRMATLMGASEYEKAKNVKMQRQTREKPSGGGSDGSFQWSSQGGMGSVQDTNPLSIDTGLSNARSMPTTPATTPPGTSIQSMQQYQQEMSFNPMDPGFSGMPNGMRPPSSRPGGFARRITSQQMVMETPGLEGPSYAPPPLPEGWIAQWDGMPRKYYFVQLSNGASQWEIPTHAAPTGPMARQQQQAQATTVQNSQNIPNDQMMPQPAQRAMKRSSSQRLTPPTPSRKAELPPKRTKGICVSYTISEDMSGDRENKILSRIGDKKRDPVEVRLRERGVYWDHWSLKHPPDAEKSNSEAEKSDSEAETIVLPGKDGHRPGRLRAFRNKSPARRLNPSQVNNNRSRPHIPSVMTAGPQSGAKGSPIRREPSPGDIYGLAGGYAPPTSAPSQPSMRLKESPYSANLTLPPPQPVRQPAGSPLDWAPPSDRDWHPPQYLVDWEARVPNIMTDPAFQSSPTGDQSQVNWQGQQGQQPQQAQRLHMLEQQKLLYQMQLQQQRNMMAHRGNILLNATPMAAVLPKTPDDRKRRPGRPGRPPKDPVASFAARAVGLRPVQEAEALQTEADQADKATAGDRPRVMTTIRGKPYDITDLGFEADFLAELPDDLRDEVIMNAVAERRSQAVATGSQPSDMDQEFLDALPDDIRGEIIQQERQDRLRRERGSRDGPLSRASPLGESLQPYVRVYGRGRGRGGRGRGRGGYYEDFHRTPGRSRSPDPAWGEKRNRAVESLGNRPTRRARERSRSSVKGLPPPNLDQLKEQLPPLDLSSDLSSVPSDYNFSQNRDARDGHSAIPDHEQPVFSAGLGSASIDWSHYDGLNFDNEKFQDGNRRGKSIATTTSHPQARSMPKGFNGLKSEATMRERLLKEAQRISELPIPTGISAGGKRSRDEDDGVPISVPRSRLPPPGLDLGWERQPRSGLHPSPVKREIVEID